MTIIDILKILCVILLCAYASISDIRTGIIKNKYLLIFSIIGLILDIVSWCIFEKDSFFIQLVNIAVVCIISVLMYVFRIWAGGDCKYTIAISLLLPFSLYPIFLGKWYVLVLFMAIAFVFSYFYLIVDSIRYAIKSKKVVSGKKLRTGLASFLLKCVINLAYIVLIDGILILLFPYLLSKYKYLTMIVNICIVLIISGIKHLSNIIIVSIIVLTDIIICSVFNLQMINRYMILNYLIACLTLIFRFFIDEYNYEIIKTKDVKKGTILSISTILAFADSHVKGLPTSTTEDIRSRLSEDEAQSIHRWEKSTYGTETVQIVRKIPFAIFLSIGAIVFLILGGILK